MKETESLAAAIVLASAYVLGRGIRVAGIRHHRGWISVAAGASVAYIFVHVLPELSERQAIIMEVHRARQLLLTDTHVYIAALAGFVLYYALDTMAVSSRTAQHEAQRAHQGGLLVYRLHIAGFALYAGLVGYLLVDWAPGARSLMLYTAALAFHFLVVDHSLREEYADLYDRGGRWILSASVLLGWAIGAFSPIMPTLLSILVGFISGGVVINSIKDELPKSGEGRFVPFALAAAGYSILLLLSEGLVR